MSSDTGEVSESKNNRQKKKDWNTDNETIELRTITKTV